MHHFEYWAPLVHTFCPVTTHSSPSRLARARPPASLDRAPRESSGFTARVLTLARSEPASGSEKPWHQISSAVRIRGRQRSFCAGVPGPPPGRYRRPGGQEAEDVGGQRRAGPADLLEEDRRLRQGRAPAAVL